MFEELLTHQNGWFTSDGPYSDIVFSSRIRLARNLSGYPFPLVATLMQKKDIIQKLCKVHPTLNSLRDSVFIAMDEQTVLDRQFLLERHLVSQDHIVSCKGKGLIVSQDEQMALMINEEDHLRMQVIKPGLDLLACWEAINNIDNDLNKALAFCFLPDFGYLTSCPTNVGTALRASCMLHLPALVLTKRINKILELLIKVSFTTRGLFGEGTQALGDFFQISNQASLGLSETEIIDNLYGVVNQIKDQEIQARDTLLKKHKSSLEDNVWRALGILGNARLMSSKEAFTHLSILCLGLDLGIIKGIDRKTLSSLFIIIQPAHLQKIENRIIEGEERDRIRAVLLRDKLRIGLN